MGVQDLLPYQQYIVLSLTTLILLGWGWLTAPIEKGDEHGHFTTRLRLVLEWVQSRRNRRAVQARKKQRRMGRYRRGP